VVDINTLVKALGLTGGGFAQLLNPNIAPTYHLCKLLLMYNLFPYKNRQWLLNDYVRNCIAP